MKSNDVQEKMRNLIQIIENRKHQTILNRQRRKIKIVDEEKEIEEQIEEEIEEEIEEHIDGVIYSLYPSNKSITTSNMRVTGISSTIDDQLVNVHGDIFFIEDYTYRISDRNSILFWDTDSYIHSKISVLESNNTYVLVVSLKIPEEQVDMNGQKSFFSHVTADGTLLSVSYDLKCREMCITFHDQSQTDHRHTFDSELEGEFVICIECVWNNLDGMYDITFDIIRMFSGSSVESHSKRFQCANMMKCTESVVEIGKVMCFVGDVQYYVGNLSVSERSIIKTKFVEKHTYKKCKNK